MHALLFAALLSAPPTPPEGVLPVGADGKPLNFDFETGTLKDWTADGKAFEGQPVKGDLVARRRGDMKSRHQGEYWIGGYEKVGDKPTGTLTSVPFKVTHPWASFLIGGGPWTEETCVEIFHADKKYVIHRATGLEEEDLKREVVDLRNWVGHELQIRLVDKHTGHWGHLNFDDFRFHADKPAFPARGSKQPPAKPDEYKYAGLEPKKAAEVMTVPEGFHVTLFAGEPDVHQPVAFCIDDRGRLWVAEAYAYPKRLPFPGPVLPEAEAKKGDRILIFEDADGDGVFDKKTVFIEGLNLVSGIEVGFGGVWVGAAPYLFFIPAKDDKPAGPPVVLLDGWDAVSDTHETLNTFCWGPDGWLYGCHGVFTRSRVGKPGTPDKDRTPINAGVWRYHPTKHVFEVFSHGTSNPWGLDYNQYGDFFIEACVIPHCYHMIQGGRYERQAGQHFNPYTYDDIKTIADHRHYVGANPHGGNNRSDSLGGGHAHCGLMCYLGGAWPKEYHGQLFMGNIHGRRINVDIPVPKGSGYVAKHGKDFLLANDAWARFINLKYGPDGNVYLIDWYDKQACHRNEPEIWDRTNGRVYKISYKGTKAVVGLDLQKCSDEELVKYQLHENEWYASHARRILQERAAEHANDKRGAFVGLALKEQLKNPDEGKRLRALWALYTSGQIDAFQIQEPMFGDVSPVVRSWCIALLAEMWFGPGVDPKAAAAAGPQFARMMGNYHTKFDGEITPTELRRMASAAQRVPAVGRAELLKVLFRAGAKAADGDPNLPYLYWYALEPLASENPAAALDLAADSGVPSLLPFAARRVAALGTPAAFDLLTANTLDADTPAQTAAYLRGLLDGLRGRREVAVPKQWPTAFAKHSKSADPEIRSLALSVAVALRDPGAMATFRELALDPKADTAARQAAVAALLDARDNRLGGVLKELVKEPALRGQAIRSLAAVNDAGVPAVLLGMYPTLTAGEKRDAVNTLAARPAYAAALLDAVAAKAVPAADVPAEIVRQLRNLGDTALDAKIASAWGVVRDTPADRKRLIADWAKKLSAGYQGPPDLPHGRAVFARVCQQCHTLYGVGGKVGPDITGANRADLGYLLENIFDPSAVIPKEYAATKLDLEDGRVVTGIIKEETKTALTVVTANEVLSIPLADVAKRTPSPLSMMPDDLTKTASEADIKALVSYLRYNRQVPMKATPENAKDFFNGKDLTGWDADPAFWKVENGELVGKTATGLKRNNFAKGPMVASDFKLTVKVKLTPNAENSGIQFRSEPLDDGEMKGPQADIGAGWWGKLYEESGRGLLWKESGEKHVKPDDWNEYAVEAVGSRVRTWINGRLCVDLDDPKLSKSGLFGFQMHSGKAMEVRYKEFKLEVLTK